MNTPEHDQFVSQVFGVDLSQYGTSSNDEEYDPPPAIGEATPPPTIPAGSDTAGRLAKLRKQISSLGVLGSALAAGFKTRLDAIDAVSGALTPETNAAITKLADDVKAAFDEARKPPEPSAAQLAKRKEAARAATGTAGSGTADDVDLVVNELAKMPKALLDALKTNGTKVKVCRGSVTDYLTELRGVKPRGWPPGMTWDSVPGLQQPAKKEVVIATIGHAGHDAHVPKTNEGHGSANLVIHETAHGVDFSATPHMSSGAPFNAARTPDLAGLTAYETQPGNAGQEESFAESCARFYANDPASAESTPHLHKYWRDNPLGPPDPPDEEPPPPIDGSALETPQTEMLA